MISLITLYRLIHQYFPSGFFGHHLQHTSLLQHNLSLVMLSPFSLVFLSSVTYLSHRLHHITAIASPPVFPSALFSHPLQHTSLPAYPSLHIIFFTCVSLLEHTSLLSVSPYPLALSTQLSGHHPSVHFMTSMPTSPSQYIPFFISISLLDH